MDKKRGILLTGLIGAGLVLSGCQSSGSYRGRQQSPASVPTPTASTANPAAAYGSASQTKATTSSPYGSAVQPPVSGNPPSSSSYPTSSVQPAGVTAPGYPNAGAGTNASPTANPYNSSTSGAGGTSMPPLQATDPGRSQGNLWPPTPAPGADPSAGTTQPPRPGSAAGSSSDMLPRGQDTPPLQPVMRDSN